LAWCECDVQRQDKEFAVADLPGVVRSRCGHNRLDGGLDKRVIDGYLELQFGQ
jgi:hypothetical protein